MRWHQDTQTAETTDDTIDSSFKNAQLQLFGLKIRHHLEQDHIHECPTGKNAPERTRCRARPQRRPVCICVEVKDGVAYNSSHRVLLHKKTKRHARTPPRLNRIEPNRAILGILQAIKRSIRNTRRTMHAMGNKTRTRKR